MVQSPDPQILVILFLLVGVRSQRELSESTLFSNIISLPSLSFTDSVNLRPADKTRLMEGADIYVTNSVTHFDEEVGVMSFKAPLEFEFTDRKIIAERRHMRI